MSTDGFKKGDIVLRKKNADGIYDWTAGPGPFEVASAEAGHLRFDSYKPGIWWMTQNFEHAWEGGKP